MAYLILATNELFSIRQETEAVSQLLYKTPGGLDRKLMVCVHSNKRKYISLFSGASVATALHLTLRDYYAKSSRSITSINVVGFRLPRGARRVSTKAVFPPER
jgi:hypothetical protein